MIKYIVGGVIVVLSWVLALLIDFPLVIPLLVTLVVALVIVLLLGVDKLRERRAARQLEKALSAQAQQQASTARPDMQHEIADMQAEFQKAVTALKGSKKGGKRALYALPWFAIIGPPGCGKSTALRNSGLQFPYLSASGGGVRGLGGTRNCDWWMTSEGVILDTAGRWTSEDEDHDEWVGFLDLIKRFRPKKPLNGMIAAVSVGDVGGAREEDVVKLARRIRDRIDEVQDRLKMSLPVYVLFTKCDLIPGFVETFSHMSKQDRGQIWGFTSPLSKKVDPRAKFKDCFDEMVGVLEHRSVKRMGENRKTSDRELIYAFPQQLDVLRANLEEFTANLFLENVFKETPRLRGVYFTSGTQEGRPIDRVMSRMAEAMGQPEIQLPAPQVESKSYFLRDMFANVVFKDAEIAIRSPAEVKRQRVRTFIAAAVILLFALGVSGLPAIAWAGNRSYLEDTRERIDGAREVVIDREEGADMPLRADAIEALRERAVELGEYADGSPPLFMQMGMYQDSVHEPVRAVYLDALRRRVVGPLLRQDAAVMMSFGQRMAALGPAAHPEAAEMRAMYQNLKLHIILTVPRTEHEPEMDDDTRDWVVNQLKRRWRTATDVERHDPQYQMMEDNLRYYADALGSDPALCFPRDMRAVGAVRAVFLAAGDLEMAVQGIIHRIETRHHMQDITLRSLVGRETAWLRARERVRAAFSRPAWESHVQTMLEEEAAEFFSEHWVLGNPPPETEHDAERAREEQIARLREYFLHQYRDEWENFINSLWIDVPEGDHEHVAQLTELTSGEPQLLTTLIRQVDYHVTLDTPSAGGLDLGLAGERARRQARLQAQRRLAAGVGISSRNAGRLTDSATDSATQRLADAGLGDLPPGMVNEPRLRAWFSGFIDFAPQEVRDTPQGQADQITPARRYEEQLEFLRDAVRFRISGTNVTDFTQRQRDARSISTTIIEERPDRWQERFRTLLMPPIEGPSWVPPEPVAPIVPPTPAAAAPSGGPEPTLPGGPEPTLPGGPEPTLPAAEAAAPAPAAPAPRRRRNWWD